MTPTPDVATPALIRAVGWALVHFLWQGTLIAGGLAVILAVARRAPATLRYAVSCAAMLAMLVVSVATVSVLYPRELARLSRETAIAPRPAPATPRGVRPPGRDPGPWR